MAGKFEWHKFSEVDIEDPFFDSLKTDYIEFPKWFKKKSDTNEQALVFNDDQGVGAFIYLKNENEEIELLNITLPAVPRLKIGTLRLAERFRGMRLGEGALGVSLWKWRDEKFEEIYVTVFEKHTVLVNLFEKFGFVCKGKNSRGECIYLKSRKNIDYTDPYKAFPFLKPDFSKAGIIPIFESFHDRLFPYSELKNKVYEIEEETAGNGITKVFIATPYTNMQYKIGEPVFIYRIYEGEGKKTYKSCVTSFCTITKIDVIKDNNIPNIDLTNFIKSADNKTVFSPDELTQIYEKRNVIMLELIYNGYFGKGHNVTHRELTENVLFEKYPYQISYTKEQFIKILEMGDVDVQNVIID